MKGRRRCILFLIFSALFLFMTLSCGIPRMFPWEEGYQYEFTDSSLTFHLSFDYETDSGTETWPAMTPSPGTPVFRLYYFINPSGSSIATESLSSNLASSFQSTYRNTFPPEFDKREYAARRSVTINDETVYINAYEPVVVAIDGTPCKPEPLSTLLKGIDIFQKDGNTYTAQYTLEMEEPTASTTYIILTFNGTKYSLARMNNEKFSVSDISAYIQDANRAGEFLPEEGDVLSGSPSIGFFAGCSFSFEDYTTRRTISHAVRSII